jgi:hypothetical protein
VDQHQFDKNNSQRFSNIFIVAPAGGMAGQNFLLEFGQQIRNKRRSGKGEAVFAHHHLTIVAGPGIDATKPLPMY